MLHPDLDDLIRHIRARGMMAGLITNGYFLVPKRIEELNDAGLDFLQISIDNVEPDEVSKKSLRVLDKKLQHLKDHADFDVNINSVARRRHQESRGRADDQHARARELGFSTSIGIIHDGSGRLKPLGPIERAGVRRGLGRLSGPLQVFKNLYSGITNFQNNLADGKPNEWRCRAGARYLYICEEGLVHYCSQQRGYPGVPLESYTDRRHPSRVRDAEVVRALLHGRLRPSRVDDGFLAVAAGHGSSQRSAVDSRADRAAHERARSRSSRDLF